ncbi:MAG TPA: alginate export family protein, partial [Cytophagales bacterium]|nr:alginate export family protein [Cytophagales bacterium]
MLTKTLNGSLFALLVLQSSDMAAQFLPAQPAVQPVATPLWTINAQVRTRSEYRSGVGNPYVKDSWPAYFTSQRTNLNVGYRWDKVNFNIDLRDVRVWGQDASSINNADGNKLFLHQGWADIVLGTTADTNARLKWFDNLSLKIGRQELIYDDVRLLGNLDWLQQGRRHDAAIVKILKKGFDIHAGFAMNQNTDAFGTVGNTYTAGNSNSAVVNGNAIAALPGIVYTNFTTTKNKVTSAPNNFPAPFASTPPSSNGQLNQYKFFQYLYATRKFNQTKISLLAFKDDFQQWKNYSRTLTLNPKLNTIKGATGLDSAQTMSYDTATVNGRDYNTGNKLNTRITLGGQFSTQFGNVSTLKAVINGGAYYQMGALSDRVGAGKKLNASHFFVYTLFSKGKFSIGPGYEYLSGNSTNYTPGSSGTERNTNTNEKFDPLYGTPHR